jgi:hypothetical protein
MRTKSNHPALERLASSDLTNVAHVQITIFKEYKCSSIPNPNPLQSAVGISQTQLPDNQGAMDISHTPCLIAKLQRECQKRYRSRELAVVETALRTSATRDLGNVFNLKN